MKKSNRVNRYYHTSEDVFNYIKKYFDENMYMPSIREIVNGLGYKSVDTVMRALTKLESTEHLKLGHKARAIVLLKEEYDRGSEVSKKVN